jgi:DNA-binding transcriptional LysR family regulator
MIDGLTLHQLQCFEAVVTEGSFQAAAEKLRRSQPTISPSVKNLEAQLQLGLLDRSGYRVTLTEAGRSFYERTRVFLHDAGRLRDHAAQLAMGEESELRVVIGDLSPLPETLSCFAASSMAAPAQGCTSISKHSQDRGSACSTTRRI